MPITACLMMSATVLGGTEMGADIIASDRNIVPSWKTAMGFAAIVVFGAMT
jgi:hypothetical protein